MPVEIHDKEEFVKISDKAIDCRVKRLGEYVKVKLRTKRKLYTIKVKVDEADELIGRLKVKCTEI
ncbi:MAG: hypothetical protein DRO23_05025 [Thermoprotei archaeon]|nr:MAG: hypothetical protein DRO23_05025 [Thermoprotei archaeon]